MAPFPATEVAARLRAQGSGAWPGRHSQTVCDAARIGRTVAPAPAGNDVNTPAPTTTAEVTAAAIVAPRRRVLPLPIGDECTDPSARPAGVTRAGRRPADQRIGSRGAAEPWWRSDLMPRPLRPQERNERDTWPSSA